MEYNYNARNGHVYDSNARMVFENPELCAQFLRDFSGIDLFKDIKPEDLIDETKKYQRYLGIEFESDTVKSIKINRASDVPMYLLALIEHKSAVDYDVVMQLLRYIVCIWDDYAKSSGQSRNKGFKYPFILPIVYYEGKHTWTAAMELKDRIELGDVFTEFIPNFQYKLVNNRYYSNDELIQNNDEISLFMLINKLQSATDIKNFFQDDSYVEQLNRVLLNASEHTVEILATVVWNLCMRLNLPQDEASDFVKSVGERNMGILFENMDKIDIQAQRREIANLKIIADEQRAIADEQRAIADEQKARADEQRAIADEQKARADEQKARADEQKARADEQKARADEQKARADEQSARAESAETRAINAEAEIRRLQELLAKHNIKT